jgi:hypothetical protein
VPAPADLIQKLSADRAQRADLRARENLALFAAAVTDPALPIHQRRAQARRMTRRALAGSSRQSLADNLPA